ncbi:unnamed protein product [Coregonus sp. 'balchen']|nr:unnamed protein product [Coregonus sp. 'balchen']
MRLRLPWRHLALCGVAPGRRATSSVPAGVQSFVPASSTIDAHALERLQAFFSRATRLFVITGAGLSTESGIPDYRSDGQWEKQGKVHWLVTQNVDALHSKAGHQGLTELHGCAHRVLCLGCGAMSAREELQKRFAGLNPGVPPCKDCGGILKQDVTFFGDTVNRGTVQFVHERLVESDAVLVAGSSLQVYSGYRFLLAAADQKIPVAILNIGPTSADHLTEFRVSARCGEVLSVIQPH